ncbi:hypothetical protein KVR01_004178 [Diaporthe batatas]|uniref:uncharacterized protein n=1 Tax=Diaporthe batatas TaxID=748121 RepID=UPI001D05277C|nr:uncharacterized protein KVR01_004178 [Diaporthe batatas]KAG8165626.1 hypothetical protein KVR01_004178 [Diaporthe batatas]
MIQPPRLLFLLILAWIKAAHATTVTRHCECQSPLSKLENLSGSDIDDLLGGKMKWPMDNSTTAACCKEMNPPGKINGPGDPFEVRHMLSLSYPLHRSFSDLAVSENICSVQKDVMGGTNNAAYQFLICCYTRMNMLGDCYD